MDTLQTQLKGYTLKERIGAGGLGAVYRALQSTVGREVAIKVILPHFANHPDFIRRFETEAQLVARLEHPHIIPLYDYWRDPEGAYLVMRYLRGGSLRDALEKDGAFTPEAAALLLDQICAALAAAHRGGVIHRDLKPGNILLDEDGNAYLADFGIAKDLLSGQPGVTEPEALVGSPDYLAPEQARSETVTPRTDIYSLGVVLYELLAGEHPFPNLNAIERLFKHLSDPLPLIMTLAPDIRDDVNAVIQKATSKNPAGRYADALEMSAAFRAAINARTQSVVELLTPREQEILSLIIDGHSNKEIAAKLVVEIATIKWYITQIYRKLGVRGRVQAIVRARELNLITRDGTAAKPLDGATVLGSTSDFQPENPYKGLRAFQTADHDDFFGREKLTEKLVKRMGERGDYARFLAVVGPSGSGKSSLVKAGLIPALWRGGLPGSEKWFTGEMLPGAHPLDELEIALTRIAANPVGNLNEHLRRDERGLVRAAGLLLPNDGADLLLVIDQFEEVFTLVTDEAERTHFLNLLVAAVTEPHSRLRIVITLRADFYDRPLHYPQFGDLLRERIETVLPLSAEELERAIAKPAGRVGATFEPGLVSAIIGEVNYQPGALPLLQYALTELFERRQGRVLTREAYQAIGGAGGALAKSADDLYRELTPEGQEAARQMFLRLVTLGEGSEDTRRRVGRSELLALATPLPQPLPNALGLAAPLLQPLPNALGRGEGVGSELMDEILDTYAEYRLLSLDNDPDTRTPTVEVAHEALLREWERLRAWLNESRLDIRAQRQLSALAAEWKQSKHDSSFLARGSRLEMFEAWANETQLAMTPLEREYLNSSLTQREQERQAEAERKTRETHLEKRAQRFLRGLVALMAIALLGAVGLTSAAVYQGNVAQQNAHEAQQVALIAGSQAALANDNTDLAIALAIEAVTLQPNSAQAQAALSEAAYSIGTMRVFVGHSDYVDGGTFSPDGTQVVSASWDGTVRLWDTATGAELRQFAGHNAAVSYAEFSPDGASILSASFDGTLIQWDIQTGAIIKQFENAGGELWTMSVSPDGQYAAAAGAGNDVFLWNVETGALIRRLVGHGDSIERVRFSADGQWLLSASHDTTLILWEVESGTPIRRLEGHQVMVTSAVFSPDNTQIASSSLDGTLRLWDVESGELLHTFIEDRDIWDVTFTQDSRLLISVGIGGGIVRWNIETGQIIGESQGHDGTISSLELHPDGRRAITSAADGTLRLWDFENGNVIYRLEQAGYWWNDGALSPDGELFGIIWRTPPYSDILLIDMATGEELRRYQIEGIVEKLAFSPDGQTLVFGTDGQGNPSQIILLDVATFTEIRRIDASDFGLLLVEFTPDGQQIVSGARGGALVLWDAGTGAEIRRFTGYESSDTGNNFWLSAAFTPDGRSMITPHFNGVIVEWDVTTGEEVRQLEGHEAWAYNFVLSEDGRRGYSGAEDRAAILWDVPNGVPLRRFTNVNPVAGVALSRDGHYGLEGITAQLRDLRTGSVIRRYSGLLLLSWFTPDNRTAIVAPPANAPELWRIDLTLDDLLTWTYANRYIPELTCDQRALYRLEPLCSPTPSG